MRRRIAVIGLLILCAYLVVLALATPDEWRFPWTRVYLQARFQNGDTGAALKLYYHYAIVDRDKDTALQWLRRAAEAGSTEAQFMYGSILQRKGDNLASYWFCLAARQGHLEAAYRFGLELLSRKNDMSRRTGMKFLANAASKGHIHGVLAYARAIAEDPEATVSEYREVKTLLRSAAGALPEGSSVKLELEYVKDQLEQKLQKSEKDSIGLRRTGKPSIQDDTPPPAYPCEFEQTPSSPKEERKKVGDK